MLLVKIYYVTCSGITCHVGHVLYYVFTCFCAHFVCKND